MREVVSRLQCSSCSKVRYVVFRLHCSLSINARYIALFLGYSGVLV